jgi:signal transduction histidine kinase
VRGLGGWTILFLVLTLLPAGALGWLGLRATGTLEEQAREAGRAAELRVAAGLDERIRGKEAECTGLLRRAAESAADVLRETMPVSAPFAARSRACAAAEKRTGLPGASVRVLDARGQPWDPLKAARLDALPEWGPLSAALDEAAHEEFVRDDPAAALATLDGTAKKLISPALRARVWAAASRVRSRHPALGDGDETAQLAALPDETIVEAGPMALEALRGSPRHAELLGRGWIADAPRTEGPVATAEAPLPAGARALVSFPREPLVRRFLPPERIDGLDVVYEISDGAPGLVADAAGGAVLVRPFLGGTVRARVRYPGLGDLAASARRRRLLTAVGSAGLLCLLLSGTFLARRALLKERAALALRNDFIANVSHELRTPLTSVRMHAEMLAEGGLDEGRRRSYAAVVEAEGARLSALVEDLLDFAALERGTRRLEPEPTDLGRVAAAMADAWRPIAARDGVMLEAEAASPLAALADATALSRILGNLIQNALRHGRPKRISLRAAAGPALEVADDGAGIEASERERIFERFHRGKASKGAGLGLALSRELARAMGGDLALVDRAGETCFRLSLPRVPEADA